jgi:hypothetical protein
MMKCDRCGRSDPSEVQSPGDDWLCPDCRIDQIPGPEGLVSITIPPPAISTAQMDPREDALELQKKEEKSPENVTNSYFVLDMCSRLRCIFRKQLTCPSYALECLHQ